MGEFKGSFYFSSFLDFYFSLIYNTSKFNIHMILFREITTKKRYPLYIQQIRVKRFINSKTVVLRDKRRLLDE